MDAPVIKVLLIRKSRSGHSPLTNRLSRHACECRLAISREEAGALLTSSSFDLVLGPIYLNGDSFYPMMELLLGSSSTMFYSLPVEYGSWWLPAVWLGRKCFGAPAIHHSKFVKVLDQTIGEIRSRMGTRSESLPAVAAPLSNSTIEFPFSSPTLLPALPRRAKILEIVPRRASN
jgi:hypothetical protein